MKDEIRELFLHFDEDGSGDVDAGEIQRSLQAFGMMKTYEECLEMI